MAAMKRAWMNIERNIYAKYQLRLASGTVLGRLKKLVGISEMETNVAVSDVNEPIGEFMYQNVEKRIKTVASKSLILTSDMNWKDTQTDDISSKYKFLKACHEEFGTLPPNNVINDSSSVNDFLKYYESKRTPGIIPEMWKLKNQKLPKNLSFEAPLPLKRA